MTLLADERQRLIFERARTTGGVRIIELAEEFDVSVETIRRDINRLTEQSKLRKVHGGAVPVKQAIDHEPSYNVRISKNMRAKTAIGEYAARLIKSGSIVMLDCGVTIQCLARAIVGVSGMTFITNSLPTAGILLDKLNVGDFSGKVFFIGGRIEPDSRFATGSFALAGIDGFNADVSFVSTTSIAVNGFYMYDTDEGAFSAKLLGNSNTSYVLAESEKFGHVSAYRFADFTAADTIITENNGMNDNSDAGSGDNNFTAVCKAAENAGTKIILA